MKLETPVLTPPPSPPLPLVRPTDQDDKVSQFTLTKIHILTSLYMFVTFVFIVFGRGYTMIYIVIWKIIKTITKLIEWRFVVHVGITNERRM